MLPTLIQELDDYTNENFHASVYAVRARVYLDLYDQGHISREVLFNQFETVVHAQIDRTNLAETADKIKLDSLLYRIKEWLER